MKSVPALVAWVTIAVALPSTASATAPGPQMPVDPPAVEGPFVGTLPCADCEGIVTELTLVRAAAGGAPSHYRLRETYLGKPAGERVFESKGPWAERRTGAGTQVRLDPRDPAARRSFLRLGPGVLELLDRKQERIRTSHDLKLRLDRARSEEAAQDAARVPLRLFAGVLRRDGARLVLLPCAERMLRPAADVSPESQITAVLTDLGFDARGQLYVEAWGLLHEGEAQLARLNRAGTEMRCPAPGQTVNWQAQGNEPFWSLRCAGDSAELSAPGEPALRVPAGDLTWRWRGGRTDRATAEFRVRTGATRVSARLEPGICRDTMADAVYGWRAEVQANRGAAAWTRTGCAFLGPGVAPPG
jgi:copper homeostasis protein (lipoprotein)